MKKYSSHIAIVILVLLSLYPIATAIRYPHYFLLDDAFITLTYSKNIALGKGFVYNHPPATFGTTTPLFALIIAALSAILPWIDIPVIAVFFTTFCWIGIVWLFVIFRNEWQLNYWKILVIALVFYVLGWIKFLGMEAYLFAFLLTLSVSLFLSGRRLLTGFSSGLLFLTRGEGVLVLPAFLLFILIRDKKEARHVIKTFSKILIGFLLPTLLWFLFAYFNFGAILPNTLAAKQAQGQANFLNTFFMKLVNFWLPLWFKQFEILPTVNLSWLFVLAGFAAALRHSQWLIWIGWIALYILGYSILKVSTYSWYFLPVIFVLNILLSLGFIQIIEFLYKNIKNNTFRFLTISVFATISLWTLITPAPAHGIGHRGDPRAESYINLSQWLNKNTKSDESVAYIEIGYLGYYTNNRIIDLAGLILPDIVQYISRGDFASGFWNYRPDYYIYIPDFDWALSAIRADPRFEQEYQPVATLPGPRETNFTIYKRRNPSN